MLPWSLFLLCALVSPALAAPQPLSENADQPTLTSSELLHDVALLNGLFSEQGKQQLEAQLSRAEEEVGVGRDRGMAIASAAAVFGGEGPRKIRASEQLALERTGRPIRQKVNISATQSGEQIVFRHPYYGATRFVLSLLPRLASLPPTPHSPSSDEADDQEEISAITARWVPLPTHQRHIGYWTIPLSAVVINDSDTVFDNTVPVAIFDVTINRLAFPPPIAAQVYSYIPGSAAIPSSLKESPVTSYWLPCSSKVNFILLPLDEEEDNVDPGYLLRAKEFLVTPLVMESGGGLCLGAVYGLAGLDLAAQDAQWIDTEILL